MKEGQGMRCMGLHCAILILGVGCGAAAPGLSGADDDFALSPPRRGAAPPVVDCPTDKACQKSCEQGVATACTKAGDFAFQNNTATAARFWMMGCQNRDGSACARLMAITAEDRKHSNGFARHACAYGSGESCELLGMSEFHGALLLAGKGRKRRLRKAAVAFDQACNKDRWLGCAWGAITHYRLPSSHARAEIVRLGRRAHLLGIAACNEGDPDACAYLAFQFDRAGRKSEAAPYWAKGCRALLTATTPPEREKQLDTPVCKRAAERGVQPKLSDLPADKPETARRELAANSKEAKRLTGRTLITPSPRLKLLIHKRRISKVTAHIKLCLSELGLPTSISFRKSSGFAVYDWRLFSAMRAWRYSPYIENGKPQSVCTTVTFIYRQT